MRAPIGPVAFREVPRLPFRSSSPAELQSGDLKRVFGIDPRCVFETRATVAGECV
jgi:hypothetical protein